MLCRGCPDVTQQGAKKLVIRAGGHFDAYVKAIDFASDPARDGSSSTLRLTSVIPVNAKRSGSQCSSHVNSQA
jgi:hypothetical protein